MHPPGAVDVEVGLIVVRAFEHGGDTQSVVGPGWFVDSLGEGMDALDPGQTGVLEKCRRNALPEARAQGGKDLAASGTVRIHDS